MHAASEQPKHNNGKKDLIKSALERENIKKLAVSWYDEKRLSCTGDRLIDCKRCQ